MGWRVNSGHGMDPELEPVSEAAAGAPGEYRTLVLSADQDWWVVRVATDIRRPPEVARQVPVSPRPLSRCP